MEYIIFTLVALLYLCIVDACIKLQDPPILILPFSQIEDIAATLLKLKSEGYIIIALEITSNSIKLEDVSITPEQKIVLLLGDERMGISKSALLMADISTHIEMFGQNSSMNVAVALGIACFEFTKKLSEVPKLIKNHNLET